MPISKPPSKDILDYIDFRIVYLPISGKLIWENPVYKAMIGKEVGTIRQGKRACNLNYTPLFTHNICWYKFYGEWPIQEIDHIDRNGLNNKITNLRLVNRMKNVWNRGPRYMNNTGEVGITWLPKIKRYNISIARKGVRYHKRCLTLEEAIATRDDFYAQFT